MYVPTMGYNDIFNRVPKSHSIFRALIDHMLGNVCPTHVHRGTSACSPSAQRMVNECPAHGHGRTLYLD